MLDAIVNCLFYSQWGWLLLWMTAWLAHDRLCASRRRRPFLLREDGDFVTLTGLLRKLHFFVGLRISFAIASALTERVILFWVAWIVLAVLLLRGCGFVLGDAMLGRPDHRQRQMLELSMGILGIAALRLVDAFDQ